MNKVLLVGRLVRDPEAYTTGSDIRYTRFTIAVNRPYGEDQADFIPIVAWRNQADFVANYMKKGSLISVEGRFTSSTYNNNENQTVTRYEVTADRIQSLETKAQTAAHTANNTQPLSSASTQEIKFAEESKPAQEKSNDDVPWELDL